MKITNIRGLKHGVKNLENGTVKDDEIIYLHDNYDKYLSIILDNDLDVLHLVNPDTYNHIGYILHNGILIVFSVKTLDTKNKKLFDEDGNLDIINNNKYILLASPINITEE